MSLGVRVTTNRLLFAQFGASCLSLLNPWTTIEILARNRYGGLAIPWNWQWISSLPTKNKRAGNNSVKQKCHTLLRWLPALAALLLALTLPLAAEVLVPGKSGFTRYDDSTALVAFLPKPSKQTKRVVAQKSASGRVPRSPVAKAAVLTAIEKAGLRYATDRAIAKAGLTAREWVALFRSNIEIESAYKPHARSHVGAIGLGQLMPATAKALGVDPYDIHQNLDGSARYLLAMLRKFGSKELALAAYNAGPHAVERYGGIPPFKETQGHVRKVVAVFHRNMGI